MDDAARPAANAPGDFHDIFGAQPLGAGEDVGAIRVEHALQQAFAIPQVNENHAAMITPTVNPATNRHGLIDERGRHVAAVMRAHVVLKDRKRRESGAIAQ